jgi:hypothetical protein
MMTPPLPASTIRLAGCADTSAPTFSGSSSTSPTTPAPGHWAPEERPTFVASLAGELAARGPTVLA